MSELETCGYFQMMGSYSNCKHHDKVGYSCTYDYRECPLGIRLIQNTKPIQEITTGKAEIK